MAKGERLLMMLETSPGQAISGESSASFDSTDELMKGFSADRFFELTDFNCSAGLADAAPAQKSAGAPKGRYSKFMSGARISEGAYPLELEPVSIRRNMDGMTTTLLKACLNSTTFAAASIVRRVDTGGEVPRAFLRLDFTNVLFTGTGWEEGETIQETYKFICRGLKVQYRPEASEGRLGAIIPGVWPKS